MPIRRVLVASLILIAIITSSGIVAKADSVTFTIGNNSQQDEENLPCSRHARVDWIVWTATAVGRGRR